MPTLPPVDNADAWHRIAVSLGLNDDTSRALWGPEHSLSQAWRLLFLTLPARFAGLAVEYHRLPSGHTRIVIATHDMVVSEVANPDERPNMAILRAAVTATLALQKNVAISEATCYTHS